MGSRPPCAHRRALSLPALARGSGCIGNRMNVRRPKTEQRAVAFPTEHPERPTGAARPWMQFWDAWPERLGDVDPSQQSVEAPTPRLVSHRSAENLHAPGEMAQRSHVQCTVAPGKQGGQPKAPSKSGLGGFSGIQSPGVLQAEPTTIASTLSGHAEGHGLGGGQDRCSASQRNDCRGPTSAQKRPFG